MGRFSSPQPMLRALADVDEAATVLAEALAQYHGQSSRRKRAVSFDHNYHSPQNATEAAHHGLNGAAVTDRSDIMSHPHDQSHHP